MNVNWVSLIMQIAQLAAGAFLTTQDDPNLKQVGTVLIGSGIGQSFPSGLTRKP